MNNTKFERYDDYKDSEIEWIEEIPVAWGVKRIKDFAYLQSGSSITSEQIDEEGDFPVYGGNGLRGFYSKYTNDGSYILIGRQGALCGNINYAIGKFWASEHAVVVYLKDTVHMMWFGELLRTMNLNQYSLAAAQPGLAMDRIKRLLLPVPPLSEQIAITDYLDNRTAQIDLKINLLSKKATHYRDLKQSLINETVTRGLDKTVGMKDSEVEWVGKIPTHWEIHRVKEKGSVNARIGWKALKASEYVDDGFAFLSTPNIKNKDIDFENVNYITYERYVESPEIMLKEDDILLAKDGSTLGIVNIVKSLPRETTVNSSIGVLRFDKTVFNKYLFYQTKSKYIQDKIQLKKSGMGVPHLFQQDIINFIILIPPFSEQTAIAAYLDEKTAHIDRIIITINTQIEKFKELRKTLINDVVTGKIKVAK